MPFHYLFHTVLANSDTNYYKPPPVINAMQQIPMVPFRMEKALAMSRRLIFLGEIISKTKPSLKLNLYQAGISLMPREFVAVAIFSAVFYFAVLFSMVFLVGLVFRSINLVLPLAVGTIFSVFVYASIINYPRLVAAKHVRSLEKDLLSALQHMLIEVKSGVPLFNALVGVSEGYGKISNEFRTIAKEINAGVKETEALDEASQRNPSRHFRSVLWQISNALRSGSDVGDTLRSIVDNLAKEQMIAVKKYGQELNPFTMMYMLIAVILPTLGITFLIVFSSFSGISLPGYTFIVLLIALAMFQFFYMGIIKTKRPVMDV